MLAIWDATIYTCIMVIDKVLLKKEVRQKDTD